MLNKPIPKEKLEKLKMLILDSDGVSIPRGTYIREKEDRGFYEVVVHTSKISESLTAKINKLKKKMKVCISSGRGLIYLQSMFGPILGGGTILQAENGSLSLIDGRIIQHFKYNENYFKKIAEIRQKIKRLPISGFEPKQFILTVHAEKEIPEVYEIVKKYDPEKELKVMWNGEAFDIQKKEVSKGLGILALMAKFQIKTTEVIAIGDRVNDKELLETAGIGVSADQEKLPAPYFTLGNFLPGETLVKYLLENLQP